MRSNNSRRSGWCGLALLAAHSMLPSPTARAQEYDFPGINSLGRFFGVGYSHHGYHAAADGRYNVLTRRHPTAMYASRHLDYAFNPHYQPALCSAAATEPGTLGALGAGNASTDANVAHKPELPGEPSASLPQWLQPNLQPGPSAGPAANSANQRSPMVQSPNAPSLGTPSLGVQPPPPASGPNPYLDSQPADRSLDEDRRPSPSDRVPGRDDFLLEDGDQLLLDPEDFSSRRYLQPPRPEIAHPVNRYKQAMTPATQR